MIHISNITWTSYICPFQGGWELDESVEEAACRESLEEAGVTGFVQVLLNTLINVNLALASSLILLLCSNNFKQTKLKICLVSYGSMNWANGASLAKDMEHTMKGTCFLCLSKNNLTRGLRKIYGEEYGYVQESYY